MIQGNPLISMSMLDCWENWFPLALVDMFDLLMALTLPMFTEGAFLLLLFWLEFDFCFFWKVKHLTSESEVPYQIFPCFSSNLRLLMG